MVRTSPGAAGGVGEAAPMVVYTVAVGWLTKTVEDGGSGSTTFVV